MQIAISSLFLEGEQKVDRIRGETPILQAIKTKFDHELHFLDEQHKKKITDFFCPMAIQGNKFSLANFNREASF